MSGSPSHLLQPDTFDFAYGENSTQQAVYRDVGSPLVERALAGNNCTLFAYGQTGSGKTHSMMGADTGAAAFADDSAMAGVIPRLTTDLFARLDDLMAADDAATIQVTVTYLEIYNEDIHDLLNPRKVGNECRTLACTRMRTHARTHALTHSRAHRVKRASR